MRTLPWLLVILEAAIIAALVWMLWIRPIDNGFDTRLTPLIYLGRTVPGGAMTPVVGLTRPGAWMTACSGALIDKDIVLTAAHCMCGNNPATGDAYVGDNPTKPGTGLFYKIVGVRQKMQCSESRRMGLDLAVLRLKAPVRGVIPIQFAPDHEITAVAKSFRIVGFGATDRSGTVFPFEKREASVNSITNGCNGVHDGKSDTALYGCMAGEEIVAGKLGTPDTCLGDSGGPLLVASDGSAGQPSSSTLMIAGVTSRAVSGSTKPCGAGGIYERLTPQSRKWIADAIASLRK